MVATFLGPVNLLPEGTSGCLRLLRSERLRLITRPPQPGERGLQTRVLELVFQGAALEVRLRTAASQPWAAIGTSAALLIHLRIGLELWCCWNPAYFHLLEDTLYRSTPDRYPTAPADSRSACQLPSSGNVSSKE